MKAIAERVFRKADRILNRCLIQMHWLFCAYLKNCAGVTEEKYEKEIIVSLTSFPARIGTVHKAVKSLLIQKRKPNRIILWLAEEEFPAGEEGLPSNLKVLKKYGLEIRWCNDWKSYKKLIPALQLFPEAVIVTADDDMHYRSSWLELLYKEYLKHPDMVCSHRITKFYLEDGEYKTVPGGYDTWAGPSYLHKLTGGSGVLYPPHILYKDIADSAVFMKECATNDDIWFWLMAVLNGKKVCAVPKNPNLNLIYIYGTQKGPCLGKINDLGEKLFWKDFNNMLAYYPRIDEILREEYQRRVCNGELCS